MAGSMLRVLFVLFVFMAGLILSHRPAAAADAPQKVRFVHASRSNSMATDAKRGFI